jgi:hypothetical protein
MFKDKMTFGFRASAGHLLGDKPELISGCMVTAILVLLTLTVAAAVVNAAEIREIELTDGSVVTGEVVSLSGGIYTIRSTTLGTLRIEASKIRSIRLKGSAAARSDDRSRVKSLEDKMLGDSELMDSISTLQNDPDFQKILQDPEIMKAVQTGDMGALMKNPDFMKLLNKQAIKDMNRKLAP